jgi:hypothetical protein
MATTTLMMNCPRGERACAARRKANAAAWIARLRNLVVSALALLLMLNGARWLLQESPPAASELIVATCVLDAMAGEAAPANVCTAFVSDDNQESTP